MDRHEGSVRVGVAGGMWIRMERCRGGGSWGVERACRQCVCDSGEEESVIPSARSISNHEITAFGTGGTGARLAGSTAGDAAGDAVGSRARCVVPRSGAWERSGGVEIEHCQKQVGDEAHAMGSDRRSIARRRGASSAKPGES